MVFKKKKMVAAGMVFCMVLSLVMGGWKPKKVQADDAFENVFLQEISSPSEVDKKVDLDEGLLISIVGDQTDKYVSFELKERGWVIFDEFHPYKNGWGSQIFLYTNRSMTKELKRNVDVFENNSAKAGFYLDSGTYYLHARTYSTGIWRDVYGSNTIYGFFIPVSSVMKSSVEVVGNTTKISVNFTIGNALAKIVNDKYSVDKIDDYTWRNASRMSDNSYTINGTGNFTIRGEFSSDEWKNFPVTINLTVDGKSQNTAVSSTAPTTTSKPENNDGNSGTNTGNNSGDSSTGKSGTGETASPSGQNTGDNTGSEVTDYSGEDDIEKITLKETSLELTAGDEHEIKFSTTPSDAEADDLEWMSSNEDVAEVDDYGKITAVSAGKAKITVQTEDGEVSASLTVIVKPEATQFTSVKTSKKKITLKWKRVDGISGYQFQFSTSKTFQGATSRTEKAKSTTNSIKNLKSKKVYYVRIRTYQTISGTKYYSAWSPVGSIKVK